MFAGEGGADTMAPLRNLFMGMPPMLDALAQQTTVQLPAFLPQVSRMLPEFSEIKLRPCSLTGCWLLVAWRATAAILLPTYVWCSQQH